MWEDASREDPPYCEAAHWFPHEEPMCKMLLIETLRNYFRSPFKTGPSGEQPHLNLHHSSASSPPSFPHWRKYSAACPSFLPSLHWRHSSSLMQQQTVSFHPYILHIGVVHPVCQQAVRESRLSTHSSLNRWGKRVYCSNIWLFLCITKPAEADVILLWNYN